MRYDALRALLRRCGARAARLMFILEAAGIEEFGGTRRTDTLVCSACWVFQDY
jgi:hypothetical protein